MIYVIERPTKGKINVQSFVSAPLAMAEFSRIALAVGFHIDDLKNDFLVHPNDPDYELYIVSDGRNLESFRNE